MGRSGIGLGNNSMIGNRSAIAFQSNQQHRSRSSQSLGFAQPSIPIRFGSSPADEDESSSSASQSLSNASLGIPALRSSALGPVSGSSPSITASRSGNAIRNRQWNRNTATGVLNDQFPLQMVFSNNGAHDQPVGQNSRVADGGSGEVEESDGLLVPLDGHIPDAHVKAAATANSVVIGVPEGSSLGGEHSISVVGNSIPSDNLGSTKPIIEGNQQPALIGGGVVETKSRRRT